VPWYSSKTDGAHLASRRHDRRARKRLRLAVATSERFYPAVTARDALVT
jgi:hypothetical protein